MNIKILWIFFTFIKKNTLRTTGSDYYNVICFLFFFIIIIHFINFFYYCISRVNWFFLWSLATDLFYIENKYNTHPANTSFLMMISDFHYVLAMDVIVCFAGVGNVLRTSVCTSPTVFEAEVLWSGQEFVMMVALSSKLTILI